MFTKYHITMKSTINQCYVYIFLQQYKPFQGGGTIILYLAETAVNLHID